MLVALDVDTGVDDALALIFAIRHRDLDVRAITCVTGNVPVDQVVLNTLTVLDTIGAPDVPVARGAERPLVGPPPEGDSVHGRDGLADLGLPRPERQAARTSAVQLVAQTIEDAVEPLTVMGLGPLTNLALLARTHPSAFQRIERIVLVGGRLRPPHAGARPDFNIVTDPEAASIVFGSGVPVTMYSLDVFPKVRIARTDAKHLIAAGDPACWLAGRLAMHQVRRFGGDAGTIGDAGAVISLIAPAGLTTARHRIEVELSGEFRGRTAVESVSAGAVIDAATAVDERLYMQTFLDVLKREE